MPSMSGRPGHPLWALGGARGTWGGVPSHSFPSCGRRVLRDQSRQGWAGGPVWAVPEGGGRTQRAHREAPRPVCCTCPPASSCPLDTHPMRPHQQGLHQSLWLGKKTLEGELRPSPVSCQCLHNVSCVALPRPAANCPTLAPVALGQPGLVAVNSGLEFGAVWGVRLCLAVSCACHSASLALSFPSCEMGLLMVSTS